MDTRTADEIKVTVNVGTRNVANCTVGELPTIARWELREEIAEQLFAGQTSGQTTIADTTYDWFVND